MQNPSCIFCKIIQGAIKSTIIAQNDHVLVIQDITPRAPTHYLILPKKHIDSILTLSDQDQDYVWHMITMAKELGNLLPSKAFNLVSNNGAAAGQSVFHMHMHFLAGKNLYEHGLKL
jgi:diadenosine tetraphosphate (Ap4A) HIT family hydrolase